MNDFISIASLFVSGIMGGFGYYFGIKEIEEITKHIKLHQTSIDLRALLFTFMFIGFWFVLFVIGIMIAYCDDKK